MILTIEISFVYFKKNTSFIYLLLNIKKENF